MTGKIIWLTGNSGSGKTTLANALQQKLFNWVVLDGDVMRNSISLNSGFSKEDREEHNLRVARLAKVLSEQNKNVLVSVIAPFQSTREKIKEIINCEWVYLKRDSVDKGKSYPYEQPQNVLTFNIDEMSIDEEVESIIQNLKLFNVFVLGLPRSGTSMMTRIVEFLGVNMVYTTEDSGEKEKRDKRYKETLGEYQPNKYGFFEISKNQFECYSKMSNCPYSGCKIIIPMIGFKLNVVTQIPCKVIMMLRDPEEIKQSQEAFYSKESNLAGIEASLVSEKLRLEKFKDKKKLDYICINYRDVLNNPKKEITKIAKFIDSVEEIDKAIKSVNSNVNRFKSEELEHDLQ